MTSDFQLPAPPIGGAAATIVRWLKEPGDALAQGEPLLVVVNDRVELAIGAPGEGVLEALLAAEGESVATGVPIARLRPAGAPPAAPAAPRRATPTARRIAAAHGLDIAMVEGSGPNGAVRKRDVLAALGDGGERHEADAARSPEDAPIPPVVSAKISPAHRPLSTLLPRALSAVEVDMATVVAYCERYATAEARRGAALTPLACAALVVVEALLDFPALNSLWREEFIERRRRVALRVELPGGPILLEDAQDLSLRGIGRRLARPGELRPQHDGATFALTVLPGAHLPLAAYTSADGLAVLGVGTLALRPLVVCDSGVDRVEVRPASYFSLSYDARVLDLAQASAFLRAVKQRLERFAPR